MSPAGYSDKNTWSSAPNPDWFFTDTWHSGSARQIVGYSLPNPMRTPAITFALILCCAVTAALFAATPYSHGNPAFLQVAPVAASNGNEFYVAWSEPARD